MLNQIALVGTLKEKPVYVDNGFLENNCYKAVITVEAEDGESQNIDIYLWKQIAEVIYERYEEGTPVGIKGFLKQDKEQLYIITSRISFITAE